MNENVWISIKVSLKFVPKGPIPYIPALVQIMSWRRPGDKPLSEPIMDYRCIYASLALNELTHWTLEDLNGVSDKQFPSYWWFDNKTVLLRDMVHQISRGESAAAGLTTGQPQPLTPQGRSGGPYHVTTVSFVSRDVKTRKCNQYLPVVLTSLIVSITRFQNSVMFWMWRHCGTAFWRHGCGVWHNGLFLTTASNVNCWADVANHVTQLWQVGDMENF